MIVIYFTLWRIELCDEMLSFQLLYCFLVINGNNVEDRMSSGNNNIEIHVLVEFFYVNKMTNVPYVSVSIHGIVKKEKIFLPDENSFPDERLVHK